MNNTQASTYLQGSATNRQSQNPQTYRVPTLQTAPNPQQNQQAVLGHNSLGSEGITKPGSTIKLPRATTTAQTVQSETTPVQPTSFNVAPWMIYAGAIILAILVVSFLISAAKNKHSSF